MTVNAREIIIRHQSMRLEYLWTCNHCKRDITYPGMIIHLKSKAHSNLKFHSTSFADAKEHFTKGKLRSKVKPKQKSQAPSTPSVPTVRKCTQKRASVQALATSPARRSLTQDNAERKHDEARPNTVKQQIAEQALALERRYDCLKILWI